MQQRPIGLLALGLITSALLLPPSSSPAQQPTPNDQQPTTNAPPVIYPVGSEPQPEPSPVRWEGPTAILGSVRVDSAAKTVTATGWVNQTEGPIEVLACGLQGKVHESVFVLPLNPIDLQAALLLVGLKGGEPMPASGQGPPKGAPVDVYVEWQTDGQTQRARAESFVWHVQDNAPLPDGPWIFTGSMLKEDRFMAFAEETLVATYWDPYAIVNVGHPAGADDELLHANPRTLPPYHTPVSIIFAPR